MTEAKVEAGKAAEGRLAEDWAAWGEAKSDWSACRLLAWLAWLKVKEKARAEAGAGGPATGAATEATVEAAKAADRRVGEDWVAGGEARSGRSVRRWVVWLA